MTLRISARWQVVVVEIGLMAVETVPVVAPRDRIPAPVRIVTILEDHPRSGIFFGRVAPHVVFVIRRVAVAAGFLKPRMLIRSVIQHQVADDADIAFVSCLG